MTSEERLIAAFEALKTLVEHDKLVAIVTEISAAFGDQRLETRVEMEGAYLDPAGAAEVKAFSEAAIALVVLDEEMRSRALVALRRLLLPAPPSLAEQLVPMLQSFLPELVRQLASSSQPASTDSKLEELKRDLSETEAAFNERKAESTFEYRREDERGRIVRRNGECLFVDRYGRMFDISSIYSGEEGVIFSIFGSDEQTYHKLLLKGVEPATIKSFDEEWRQISVYLAGWVWKR